jgi:predicted component of type VI protein secretion system
MSLQIEIVSEHRDIVGDDAVREFREDGGTIGRSLQNDWILPDKDRYISGRHATIDYKGGIYYLMDTSSNGVYVNDEMEPIGRGHPRRLFDGDRLRMGDFEMVVTIDSGESLQMPAPRAKAVVPDHSQQLVDEVSLRTGVKLLDEEEITGDDEFHSTLFGSAYRPQETDVASTTDPKKDLDESVRIAVDKLDRIANTGISHKLTGEDLFDSFLDGLGINRADLHPSINHAEIMQNAGHVMREFVTGTINLLSSRANLKNTFSLEQTTVLPRHNNPLKLSQNASDLVKQLLVGKEGEYLGARDAVREVCRDLLFHQNAFLDAMNSAFIEFADRFDPDELADTFDSSLSSNFLTKFLNKSKYWDLYRDLYPIMTQKGGGRFPQMFGEEFVDAYERQIAEYQRIERLDDGHTIVKELTSGSEDAPPQPEPLGDTRRFDPKAEVAEFEAEILSAEDAADNDDALDITLDDPLEEAEAST